MRRLRASAGDTIVEVLISMAVASSVLGGAYAVVNRTLANSQQAQEHSETLAIAQGQIEQIKKLAETGSTGLYNPLGRVHCIDTDGALHDIPSVNSLPQPDSVYPEGCKGAALSSAGYYRTAFVYVQGATRLKDVFKVYVDWPGATGHSDEVTLEYRPYQP